MLVCTFDSSRERDFGTARQTPAKEVPADATRQPRFVELDTTRAHPALRQMCGTEWAMRLGIAHHFGWAVAVTASAEHEVVDRRRMS